MWGPQFRRRAPAAMMAGAMAQHGRSNPKAPPAGRLGRQSADADVCVVGGGMAGLAAALAATRHGARVVLMHERPVLGGNASSECRVHICGADRHGRLPHLRETGICEELRLDNLRRNPHQNFSLWDLLLLETCWAEPNLTLLLNCTCHDAAMDGRRIRSVTGWQMTTETTHTVAARAFVDASGDGVLAPLSGAAFRIGREGRDEYGESIAPPQADARTMGMTCLFAAREYDTPQPFEPPPWAHRFERAEDIPGRARATDWLRMGYWWIELGGEGDSIADTERLRDELLKIVLGLWDWIKNRGPHRDQAACWALDWLQFLPAKRESRRYIGAHVLTQNDLEAGGPFEDVVAYGGWAMDDHDPAGFWAVKSGSPPTTFYKTPSPYGIPYGSLRAGDVDNLLLAGRCHSATHMAHSSTRVIGTCMSMGQAVGTAAALACRLGVDPAGVCDHIRELQQMLLRDDCYLPHVALELPEATRTARLEASQGDAEPIRDGWGRQIGDEAHCWQHAPGDWVALWFDGPRHVREATLILDSAMEREITMTLHNPRHDPWELPPAMPRAFRVEGRVGESWQPLHTETDNHRRQVRVPIDRDVQGVRYVLDATRGAPTSRLYAFYAE